MTYRHRAQQRSQYPLLRRARASFARWFGARPFKSQQLYITTLNGKQFKRVVLRDCYLAAQIERDREAFGPCAALPPFVTRYENEIWVEFVDGTRVERADPSFVAMLADFYGMVYARRPRQLAVTDTPFPERLTRDLRFLRHLDLFGDDLHRALEQTAERLRPAHVWVGYDYIDPVLKNFVTRADGGGICAVDVESLADDQLLGMGVAKALLKWLDPFRALFFDRLTACRAPDFQTYLPWVELCFLARWTKRVALEGKWRAVDPGRFERFRAG
jgi:hypothetical protein